MNSEFFKPHLVCLFISIFIVKTNLRVVKKFNIHNQNNTRNLLLDPVNSLWSTYVVFLPTH